MGDYGFIDIVLFAMIAAFLILRLRSVLGKHRNSGEGKSNLGLHTLTQSQETEKRPTEMVVAKKIGISRTNVRTHPLSGCMAGFTRTQSKINKR